MKMAAKRFLCWALFVILVSVSTAVVSGRAVEIGVSSEPLDISGGGFFFDVSTDLTLYAPDSGLALSIRPAFSVGPLPLEVSLFVIDIYAIVAVPIAEWTLYGGLGPGVVSALDLRYMTWCWVGVVGLQGIRFLESLELYIQSKIRWPGFFMSPGFGVRLAW